MGLSLEVGILADFRGNDPEGEATYRDYFATLNDYLDSVDLKAHHEPDECETWSADMYGYSGLHYLRRLAAHVDLTGQLPCPGDDESSADPVLNKYFAHASEKRPGLVARLFDRQPAFARGFDHLIVHSDAEGFYLPVDLKSVLFVPDRFPVPGAMIGSVSRLLDELSRLSALLQIPQDLHARSEELWEAADSPGEGHALWQLYGIESYSCVVLTEGCRKSIASGAALVFT